MHAPCSNSSHSSHHIPPYNIFSNSYWSTRPPLLGNFINRSLYTTLSYLFPPLPLFRQSSGYSNSPRLYSLLGLDVLKAATCTAQKLASRRLPQTEFPSIIKSPNSADKDARVATPLPDRASYLLVGVGSGQNCVLALFNSMENRTRSQKSPRASSYLRPTIGWHLRISRDYAYCIRGTVFLVSLGILIWSVFLFGIGGRSLLAARLFPPLLFTQCSLW